jgi:hypothetical protein
MRFATFARTHLVIQLVSELVFLHGLISHVRPSGPMGDPQRLP